LFHKILVLSHEFPPLGGGGGRILASLCEELLSRGIECTVLTAAPPGGQRQAFSFPVVYFPTFRKARFKTSVPAMLVYLFQALWYCVSGKARGFDLLFSNMAIPAGIDGIIIRKLLKIPHVIWYHNTEVTQNRAHGAGFLFRTSCLFIGKRADANLFVSHGLMKQALAYGSFPAPAVLPNATIVTKTSVTPYHDGIRTFFFAARMEAVKNPLLVLDAVKILCDQNKLAGISFLLVGGGGLYKRVSSQIKSLHLEQFVTLKPSLPFEQMAAQFAASYALVLPSVVEGYPTTVLEAGAHGVPTIATDTIGNRDSIINDETGLLFPLNDASALAAAISRLAADPALRNRLGKGAFDRSRHYTIQKTADAFVNAVKNL
jgi:glycosyltransferase involved in cell wall biosynthesis